MLFLLIIILIYFNFTINPSISSIY